MHENDDDPGMVPIIRPFRLLLDAIKPKSGWLFPNTIGGPLDLDNLADRVLKPRLKEHELLWKGSQAYRRGFGQQSEAARRPNTVIQAILRHEDVSTTQRSYIKTVREDVTAAMKQLEAQIACTAVVQQQPPSDLIN